MSGPYADGERGARRVRGLEHIGWPVRLHQPIRVIPGRSDDDGAIVVCRLQQHIEGFERSLRELPLGGRRLITDNAKAEIQYW